MKKAHLKSFLKEDDYSEVIQNSGNLTPLLKTYFTDPHIKKIIQKVSGGDLKLEQSIVDTINEDMKKNQDLKDKSPILYEAIFDNCIETTLFNHINPNKHDDPISALAKQLGIKVPQKSAEPIHGAPTFDPIIFGKLITRIKQESPSFFPLRNMIEYHVIHNPRIALSGNGDKHLEPHLEEVDTAAATADGTFIFNVPFMQTLLNFARLKEIKIKDNKYGQKYEQHGGPFPNEYEYVEFLIRHEFMHYTYSDFHYQKVLNADPQIINWVGDFRSNHQLVQMGFNQLPMGLFSSYVNFHKQTSYVQMYEIVKREFEKLNKDQQKRLSDKMNEGGDDHSKQGQNTDGSGKEVNKEVTKDQLDKHNQKVNRKGEEDKNSKPGEGEGKYDPNAPKGNPGKGVGEKREIDFTKIHPKYKWDALLKKMVSESAYVMEPTYQKISRRAIGTMQQVITSKRGAMKPGEIKNPSKKKIKLAVIIDSSGSMGGVIETVMSNLDQLLVKRSMTTKVHDEFYLFMFSGDYDIFECTPGKTGTCTHVKDVDGTPGEHGTTKLSQVLNTHKAGGTVFSSALAGQINKLASRGYNCLVVSDSDLLSGENFTNFKELYAKHRKNVFILLDSNETFSKFISQMKEISNNASHL